MLKVYTWVGHRHECPPSANGGRQTRELVATTSKKEAARIAGETGPWRLWNLSETRNEADRQLALANPGVLFWSKLDYRMDRVWHRADGLPNPME